MVDREYYEAKPHKAMDLLFDVERLENQVLLLRRAILHTRQYVGDRALPAWEGWDWFDAIEATGGVEGYGTCGCSLDPQVFGRGQDGSLLYCTLPAGHELPDMHGIAPVPTGYSGGEI